MPNPFVRNNIIFAPTKWRNRYSLLFDGVNEYINIDSLTGTLSATTTGTWSLWVRPMAATPSVQTVLIGFSQSGSNNNHMEIILRTSGQLDFQATIPGAQSIDWAFNPDVNPLSDNKWTHIVLVQNGISPICYINGIAVAITFSVSVNKTRWFNSYTGANQLNAADIGARDISGGEVNFWNGNIDEVGFFNTNLSEAQVNEIYNGGKPNNLLKHSAVNNLVSYYRMGDNDTFDGTNWTLFDKKGTNNGTSVNMESNDLSIIVP